jgi:ATP-dependent helicase/nuclease subunit B
MRTTEYLPPSRKLVDAVADWLLSRVRRDAAGAPSLAHLLVVVPTAQANRQLRLALASRAAARGFGGILPPDVRLPMQLVAPADGTFRTASPMQARAAFLRFLRTRPRRKTSNGETVLSEWTHLFRPEAVDDFRSVLSFFDQLGDIWTPLSAAGLVMADVPRNPKARALLEAAQGDELARWEELADFETAFFAFLHGNGLRHEVEGVKLAKTAPRPLPADIEEVVLPALADPIAVLYDVLERQNPPKPVRVLVHADEADAAKFDAWGRPETAAWTGPEWTGHAWKGPPLPLSSGLRDCDIVRAATDAELAQAVARDFPPSGEDRALPALGLCDATLHPELAAAFLQAGRELHNPEKRFLPSSDPGRAAGILLAIHQAGPDAVPWTEFAALLRESDFLSAALQAAGIKPPPTRTQVLEGLDAVRNLFLPRTVPPSAAFDESRIPSFQREPYERFRTAAKALLALLDAARAAAPDPAGFVREALQRLYAQRKLDAGDEDREFLSAAKAIRGVLDEAEEAAAGAGLSQGALSELFRKSLAEATYSPEPESKAAIRTEGWLELVWSAADKIALAGFHEGSVPDAVAGHAFLPDSLREALGLSSNRQRLARDTCLLHDLLAARFGSPGSVRAYVSETNASGDIHRPSRLLFLVPDEALPARARRLFGDLPPGLSLPQRELADGWRPRLPAEVPPPGKKDAAPEGVFSASAIDTWLRCPFRYLFTYGLDMRRVEEKEELEASDFGNIVHQALERYALEQRERTEAGMAQLSDEREIAASLAAIVARLAATFGPALPLNLRLQLDAAARRLACFAPIQAMWAAEGWRIAERPEYPVRTKPFSDADLRKTVVKGSIDRIDARVREDGETEYRIIDYKTWDTRAGAWGRILKGGREAEHARRLRLPVLDAGDPSKAKRLLTVQLPLYGRCLETQRPDVFLFPDGTSRIADCCYLLLGRTAEDVAVLGSCRDQKRFEAVKTRPKPELLPLVSLALETAKTAVRRIRAGIFWPPGPSEEWKYDGADFATFSPEKDFPPGTAWRDAQEAKLAALEEGGGA